MNRESSIPSNVQDFLNILRTVGWFSRVGEPIQGDPGVTCISDWTDWPGPEDPQVAALHEQQQELYEGIMGHGEPPEILKAVWDQVHEAVFQSATSTVPYDPNEDTWHGPTAAVWHAAWAAGLVGLCIYSNRPVPSDLREQWRWFLDGHWPCGRLSDDDETLHLLIF